MNQFNQSKRRERREAWRVKVDVWKLPISK